MRVLCCLNFCCLRDKKDKENIRRHQMALLQAREAIFGSTNGRITKSVIINS